jgi:hypothetical protein
MERIAEALGVGHSTIQRDLGNLPTAGKSKPAKTASNPKGAGRPKGNGAKAKADKPRSQRVPKAVEREDKIAALKALSILLFDPRCEHSSVPTAGFLGRRAQGLSRSTGTLLVRHTRCFQVAP